MIFYVHQSSILFIDVERANLLSAIIAISSAKTITETPSILLSSTTKSLITTLKKNGEVLFP